jgi:hypothetical protein
MIKARRISWEGYVVHMGEKRSACRGLMRKPGGKRLLGRSHILGVNIVT